MTSKDGAPDRVLDAYYVDVRTVSFLTSEEERALFRAYRTCRKCQVAFTKGADEQRACQRCGTPRDFKARDALAKSVLRFALKQAQSYARKAKNTSDPDLVARLVSAANLGVLVAVDMFSLKKGTRFLTYAAWWIREKILVELDSAGIVRVPPHLLKAIRARRKEGEDVQGAPGLVYYEDVTVVDNTYADVSLESQVINSAGQKLLARAMTEMQFSSRKRYVILAHYGVNEEPQKLRMISQRLGLSKERVRQLLREAQLQLRSWMRQRTLGTSNDVFTE